MSKDEQANEINSFIDYVECVVEFQNSNQLLTKDQAVEIEQKLATAGAMVAQDPTKANESAHEAYFTLMGYLNGGKKRSRYLYLYGVHIWAYLIGLSILLLVIIVGQWVSFSIFQDVRADVIAWAGLGGCAYSIYFLRKSIYKYQLSKYYAIYWFAYPIAGMIFGLALATAFAAGFLSLQAKPTYAVYAVIAFLAGMFQEWVVGTLQDIANSIHAPKKP